MKDNNHEQEETKKKVDGEIIDEKMVDAEKATDDSANSSDEETSELNKVHEELDEVTDRYLRLQAELSNIRKRQERERQDLIRYRAQSLAKELIPAIDNLERALTIETDTEASENLKKGIEMVHNSFLQGFNKEGIEVINPLGETFDPNFHEAYTQVPAEEGQKSNEVAQVFEKGYKLHERVLRAAKVAVTI
ncbi:MAG: nucleotide exchange factor GrpE [Alkalibacterium gilvum]|uniref:Protein GrpE n=1 Tax=Alkalibacterium gilvum TaxID=1130080 RepID=A0A1H6R3Y5_9LACT|nr:MULTISPECIES: nucleotide exchange factor GrpE [Alkalibacterium]MDN6293493.1 nucleotide exchange factor GrpE [Alkalibacterium sp.]MDN6295169.1 nucleotide exchange factor GrpE [Alkalibacterium sp.]MDN6728598.1 nucleotide exchange factor GrpE [Alkalibacterium sp.]SEI49156.1 molecular chaperone GrpE [Alkalibacterium gilvum]